MPNVTIYTSPTCSACQSAKQYLKKNAIAFTEVDVNKDTAKAEEIAKKSGATVVPIINIDGKFIIGFNQKEITAALGIN